MATQYTTVLKLALPVTGELSGTWGDVVNDNITSMVEQAIAGLATINTWSTNSHTLTVANGTTSESRCAMLVAQDGAGLTAAGEIICPAATKLYVLKNSTSYAITLKTAAGTGVAVPVGQTAFLFCDGTNVSECVTTVVNGNIAGNLTVGGNATINGNTTLGDANTDTITTNARFNTDLLPSTDSARDLGTSGNSWRNLWIDGTATMALVAIAGGTINNTVIGGVTPAAATFTTLTSNSTTTLNGTTIPSSKTLVDTDSAQTLTNKTLSTGTAITAGTINSATIGASTPASGAFTSLSASGNTTIGGTLGVTGAITASGGISGAVNSTSATITGGTINGTSVGATTASTGAFTTLTSTDTTTLNGTTIPASKTLVDTDSAQTLTNKTLSTGTAITGGTINNTVIGGTTRAAGSFTTLDANGNVVLGDATSDTITANGRFNTDVVPSTTNARDLGTSSLQWKQVYATTFTEGVFPVMSQTDIGTAPNQVPLNQYLGNVAFMSSNQLVINPAATAVPAGIGDMVFELASNTSLVVKVRGSDGTVRSATLTLA